MRYQVFNKAGAVILLLSTLVGGPLSAQTEPVVIQLADQQVTRDVFNARFEIAVRMLAMRQGIQYDGQDQAKTDMLRKQYLRQRGSELIGIADTIITDETVFAEDLGVIKIGLGAVKVWVQQAILTHVRRIGVKKPRLKCLCG